MSIGNEFPDPVEDWYPLHALDDTKTNRNYVTWMMRFNDVLDVKKLNDALSRLLGIGDWRKLGGRLVFKEKGKLRVHVQRSSPTDEPQTAFCTHEAFDMRIREHPVASRFPKETDGPSVQPISGDFRPFIARPNFPTFEEIVRDNLPPISLHVTSFSDATLVALVWPHVLMDATGGRALLAAWSSVLAGREEELPTVLGARQDILRQATVTDDDGTSHEEFELEPKRLKGADLFMFNLRFLWDRIRGPAQQRRVICLPKSAFIRLQAWVKVDIAENSPTLDNMPFVSEGDILTAWVTHAVASSDPRPRPVTIFSLLNTRFRIPLVLKSSGVFIQNMVLGTYTFLSAQSASGPVGPIAVNHRRQFAEQTTGTQTLAFLKSVFRDLEAGRSPRLLFGEPQALVLIFNNLTKAELIKSVDFGPAVLRQGEMSETRKNALGTMANFYVEDIDGSYNGVNAFSMLGKDHGENYWFMGNLQPKAWAKIEESLRNLSI